MAKPQSSKAVLAIWARYQSLISAFMMLLGGLLGLFYPIIYPAILGLLVALLVLALEWPLIPAKLLAGNKLYQALYVRGIAYTILACLPMIAVPTSSSGLALFISGILYIVASVRGEQGDIRGDSNSLRTGRRDADGERNQGKVVAAPNEQRAPTSRTLERVMQ